jgi:hypothetical protein
VFFRVVPWPLTLALLAAGAAGCQQQHAATQEDAGASPDAVSDAGGDGHGLPVVMTFDRSGCAARAAATCQGVAMSYDSNGSFDATPDLAACSRYISYDGCGQLVFAFDEGGCLASVSAAPDPTDHLGGLRSCLQDIFGPKRWPCLVNDTVWFHESCFIR